jgi:hypothetical protein
MSGKFGQEWAREWFAKGPRELGGVFFTDSNIAVPMYPLRGSYGIWKESEASKETQEKTFEELHPVGPDEPGRDDPDRGIERE